MLCCYVPINCTLAGAIAVQGGQFSDPDSPVFIGAVNCSGQEANLLECSSELSPASCVEVAGIVCQGMSDHFWLVALCILHIAVELDTLVGNCTEGDLRLEGGVNNTQGRVEVCLNNAWGTICNSQFGTNEARVICHQLGFSNTSNVMLLLQKCIHRHYNYYISCFQML